MQQGKQQFSRVTKTVMTYYFKTLVISDQNLVMHSTGITCECEYPAQKNRFLIAIIKELRANQDLTVVNFSLE